WNKYKEARIIFKDFESSNWSWDPVVGAYYWHRFYSHQPDLNYDSPLVQQTMLKAIDFWLDIGVSGLRLDAVPYLYEREGTNCENLPETHAFLKKLRHHIDQKYRNRMLLAEANQWSEDAVAYFGGGDECQVAYHFPLMPRMFMAIRMEDRFPIVDILKNTPPIPENCQWALFLRNHDELTLEMVTDEERDYMYRVYAHDTQARINLGIRRRLAPLLNNDRRKIELMNGLLFSLPGTPVIYYGDEIAMGDNFYLGDRDGVRTPMHWSSDRNAGFSRTNPQRLYLPVNIDPEYHYEAVNVETQQSNPDSLLWWMKRFIALRKRFKAFGRGSLEFLQPENQKVLAFLRRYEDEAILVVANLSRLAQHTALNLGEFSDRVPVEMFGHTEFPAIGEAAYSVILNPYAFYCFSLESRRPERIDLSTKPAEFLVPTLTLTKEWRNLYQRARKPAVEAALLGYVRQHRWFGGKARYIRASQILDVIILPYDTATAHLILLKIEYAEGEPETYLLPVTFALGERADQVITELPQAVVARLKLEGKCTNGKGIIYDALIEEDFRSAILKAIAQCNSFRGQKGEIISSYTRKLYRQLRKLVKEIPESVILKGEQTNTSVVYGEQFKLKLFRHVEEGVSSEFEIGRFLAETEPFNNVPPVAGVIEYRARGHQPMTLGILHSYIHNEGDAWKYTLDSLGRYFEAVLAHPDIEVPMPEGDSLLDITEESIPPIIADTIGHYLVSTQLLGQRTAELHLTLASTVDDQDFVPEPFSIAYQWSLYHGMRGYAIQVLQLLQQHMRHLPDEVKANAENVINLEKAIIGCFKDVTRRKISGMRIRCHGDYHLGQVLYTGSDFFIVDFEGEPARHLGERRIKRSPLRDVAGMIRSFHYATYAALRGWGSTVLRAEDLPVLEDWARAWHLWVSTIFLKSYLEIMADTTILPHASEEMRIILDAYLLDKALYEVNYELNNRPDWVRLPLQGILQALETKEKPSTPEAKKKVEE
ncbi:putative maltokinase, partial [Chloroflexota bacterium]